MKQQQHPTIAGAIAVNTLRARAGRHRPARFNGDIDELRRMPVMGDWYPPDLIPTESFEIDLSATSLNPPRPHEPLRWQDFLKKAKLGRYYGVCYERNFTLIIWEYAPLSSK